MTPPRHLLPSEVTELGYYWAKPQYHPTRIGQVKMTKRDGLCFFTPDSYTRWPMMNHEWFYGPLTPPEPPSPPLEQHAPHQL